MLATFLTSRKNCMPAYLSLEEFSDEDSESPVLETAMVLGATGSRLLEAAAAATAGEEEASFAAFLRWWTGERRPLAAADEACCGGSGNISSVLRPPNPTKLEALEAAVAAALASLDMAGIGLADLEPCCWRWWWMGEALLEPPPPPPLLASSGVPGLEEDEVAGVGRSGLSGLVFFTTICLASLSRVISPVSWSMIRIQSFLLESFM